MTRLKRKEQYPLIDIQINGQIAQKRRIRTFVKSCIAYLSPKLRRDITIELNVITRCENNHYALCWGDRDEVIIEIARGSNGLEFTLEDQMLNLAHELVHAKQFLTGQLSPVRQ